MRDEQYRKPEFIAQIVQKIDYLRLNGYVKRGNGLVGNNHFGVHYNGTRNADTLTLTARKLMRVTRRMLGNKTYEFEHLIDLFIDYVFILFALNYKTFGDNITHGHTRIERSDRILKYHLNLRYQSRTLCLSQLRSVFLFYRRLLFFIGFGGDKRFVFCFDGGNLFGGVIFIAIFVVMLGRAYLGALRRDEIV